MTQIHQRHFPLEAVCPRFMSTMEMKGFLYSFIEECEQNKPDH